MAAAVTGGSVYLELLRVALEDRVRADGVPSARTAMAELIRCRRRTQWNQPGPEEPDWAVVAIADQVAYDIALIRYARCVGVDCELDRFSQPAEERRRIETALAARGLVLGR